jgi:hypothetical protein
VEGAAALGSALPVHCMPAEASPTSDEATPEPPALDPLALLTELLGRMAADPDADAEASAYAQRALERARAERNAALRSASELVAGRSDAEEPEGVAQAMARFALRSASIMPHYMTRGLAQTQC